MMIMKQATLCFLVKGDRILLGYKKQGFGRGKYNGFGGKIKEGETPEQTAVRELSEESGVKAKPDNIRKVADLELFFPDSAKDWEHKVHVFFADSWEGEPEETEEMRPEWFDTKSLPFDRMWQGDRQWLPLVLRGKKVKGVFVFDEDRESIKDMLISELE
jgi:8-oxo-dGTP pyrophosphatase MutT (NUDIX family)